MFGWCLTFDTVYTMDYPKFIVLKQKGESISIQRVKMSQTLLRCCVWLVELRTILQNIVHFCKILFLYQYWALPESRIPLILVLGGVTLNKAARSSEPVNAGGLPDPAGYPNTLTNHRCFNLLVFHNRLILLVHKNPVLALVHQQFPLRILSSERRNYWWWWWWWWWCNCGISW